MAKASIGRLKKRAEFLKVNAANRKYVTPGLILQARPRGPEENVLTDLRLGFTVSKKVGNSVMRNRARRRLRAAAAQIVPGDTGKAFDLVLIGRAGTLTRAYLDLCHDLEQALQRMGVARKADAIR